jgi:pimeloyl-ACP methyl ester carboxylesterase
MASTQAAAAVPRPTHFYTEPEWLEVGGLPVAYRRKGTGEPTLYLHGAGMTRMWLPHLEALSEHVDVIAPEHPGYGETEMPDWLDGFEDLVIHYDELLDVLGLDQAHVVGYSLGGWLAAEFASYYPQRLKSLTLMVPAGLRIEGKPVPNPFAMMPDAFFDLIFNDRTNMHQVMPDFESLEEVVHQYGEGATLARIAWTSQYNLKLERRHARVTCPALVLRAEDDRLIPNEAPERYAQLLPNARIATIPGTGHALAVEQPERVGETIGNFIEEVSR